MTSKPRHVLDFDNHTKEINKNINITFKVRRNDLVGNSYYNLSWYLSKNGKETGVYGLVMDTPFDFWDVYLMKRKIREIYNTRSEEINEGSQDI